MRRRFRYSIWTMTKRLLHIAAPVKGMLALSTLTSVVGNLSQMGLMGFGALWILSCAGKVGGSAVLYGVLTGLSGLMIVLGRYGEGVVSHAASYRLLAGMRVHLFETIRRLAPACLMDRKKGDLLNIAVSDIETVEFFFAQVQKAVFQAQFFGRIIILCHLDWQHLGFGMNLYVLDFQFNIPGRHVFVDAFAFDNFPFQGNDAFRTQIIDFFKQIRRAINHTLGNAVMISQVHKAKVAQVAFAVNPTGDFDLFAGVTGAQFATGMCTIAIHKRPHKFSYCYN